MKGFVGGGNDRPPAMQDPDALTKYRGLQGSQAESGVQNGGAAAGDRAAAWPGAGFVLHPFIGLLNCLNTSPANPFMARRPARIEEEEIGLPVEGPPIGADVVAADAGGRVGKPVSLRDLAKMANVSVATVSMVLNDNPRISRATHLKVQRLIERTGYKPNRLAQSLSSRYTRVLAIMVPALRHAFADAYFGEAISGICDRAGKLGHKVMIESAKPDFIKEGQHVELFERRYVDGLLLLGFNDRHGFLADLVRRGYPMMSVNNYFRDFSTGYVCCDYRGGAEQIMNYLVQLGHRKIGMIHGAPETQTQQDMIAVYQEKMRGLSGGVAGDASWREDGRFTEQGGAAAAAALLARHPDMTAIFGGNDKMAVGAMYYCAQATIKLPGDLSITGFDDIQHTAFVNPSLTTVHVPLYEAGALACERLIERIRGRSENRVAEILPTHLVIRGSTAMARQQGG